MPVEPQELARSLIQQGRRIEAAHLLETKLILNPGAAEARMLLAGNYITLRELTFRARARDHLEILVASDAPDELRKEAAYLLINQIYARIGPLPKANTLVVEHPEWFSDAAAATVAAKVAELNRYMALDTGARRRSALPATVDEIENPAVALNRFVFGEFRAQAANRQTSGSYFTFGSCFAGNVARAMQAAGGRVESFWVGEEVNTTFSNVNLLKFILGEATDHAPYYAELLSGQDIGKLREALIGAENVIYTLGLALAFFSDDGAYLPHTPSDLRTLLRRTDICYRFSTPEENAAQLRALRDLLTRHTRVRTIFLTVSPVPLAASLLSAAAAVDDSESKAILRSAAGTICRESPEIFTYFPSFEAVRWLPCFQNAAAFGSDDGNLRHVNAELVNQIVSIFLDVTSKPALRDTPSETA